MTEQWKTAIGTDGRYHVSNMGRVRRYDGLVLTPSVPRNSREYPCVMLRHSGQRRRVALHRLVALNFIGLPPHANAQVRHLDGNHLNPRWDNLAWGTAKDNADDRKRHGTTAAGERHGHFQTRRFDGAKNPASKLSDSDVREIRGLAGQISQRSIAARFGVHQGVVWRIVNRRAWTHVG